MGNGRPPGRELGIAVAYPSSDVGPVRTKPAGFSFSDAVAEGSRQWWHQSAFGRAAKVIAPLANPYIRPPVRRHYPALIAIGALIGAAVGQAPGKSARLVVRVAGPVLLSSLAFEIAKAALRQAEREA